MWEKFLCQFRKITRVSRCMDVRDETMERVLVTDEEEDEEGVKSCLILFLGWRLIFKILKRFGEVFIKIIMFTSSEGMDCYCEEEEAEEEEDDEEEVEDEEKHGEWRLCY